MGKKFLSVAVSAAAVLLPVVAQADASSVTLYGRVNVTFENTKVENGVSKNEVVDNSSRIGFRGTEDLGGGLSAIFQVESRVRADTSGDTFATRDSWVGLKGGFGALKLGRTIGPVYYATYDYISMHNHDTGNSADALLYAPAVFANVGYMNNTVWYTSPSFGGFSVDASYSLLTETGDKPRNVGVVGAYDKGPLHLALSYAETRKTIDLDPGPAVRFNRTGP